MGHEETLVTNWMWGAVEPVKEEVRRNLRSPACEIRQVVVCFSKSNEKGRVWEKGIMNSVLKKKRYVLGYHYTYRILPLINVDKLGYNGSGWRTPSSLESEQVWVTHSFQF